MRSKKPSGNGPVPMAGEARGASSRAPVEAPTAGGSGWCLAARAPPASWRLGDRRRPRRGRRQHVGVLGEEEPRVHREQLLGLSPREADVLRLLADGCSNREIGERLFMSVKTVERHLDNLYRKLEVTNRTQAAAYAIRHGLGSG